MSHSAQPVEFQDPYLKKTLSTCKLEDMCLRPKDNNRTKLILFRILSIFTFLICLIVIVTHATALVAHEYSILYWVSFRLL